jgi:diguanylate cyclase (GGDEF)-like protein/PAS domain S-box-containing protein
MANASPPPLQPAPQSPATGRWARFRARHLFDYSAAATRYWLAIAAAGLCAGAWAVMALAQRPPQDAWSLLAGLALVALAACFPVKLPRSTHSIAVADVFIFSLLVTVGVPTAVLAAGLEALIGALRTSKRLTSRISSPTSAMVAMTCCGATYSAMHAACVRLGLTPDGASLLALCAAAPLAAAVSTGALMLLAAIKRGQPLRLADWFEASTWYISITVVAAFVAGLVHLNVQRYGHVVSGVAIALVFGLVLMLRVTARREEAERQAQEAQTAAARRDAELSQQRFVATFTHAAIGMAVVRPSGKVLQVNRAICDLLGRTETDLVGSTFCDILHSGDVPLFRRQVEAVAAGTEASFSMELRCGASHGIDLWVVVHCSRYDDPGGDGNCLIYQLHDITSRHTAESRLQHIAFHDGLTDLANRYCFNERLNVAVEQSRVDANRRFAVLFLDLDRFKVVNDSLGHVAGNTLLREVGSRLVACVRPGDLVARLGGDEFAILLEALEDPEDGLRLAQRVLDSLSKPLSINGTDVVAGASIGITFSDLGYRTADEVLRDADLAMYEAKAGGRGRVALFDNSMHERVAQKLALEADLRKAIGDGQMSVHFQPLYELEPYRLCGFEALARWVHPERGAISPAVFIALAEESGQIEALTDWVIDHAMSKLADWKRRLPGTEHLSVNVNISGRDLARADLSGYVQSVLQRHQVDPKSLTLEITESTLMGRLDEATKTMERLRASGVRFSIDDFGTGYSSLAYLSTLPIDSLKIDRSFVAGMSAKPQNVEIVRAVLTLGKALGRKVVAEGIETTEQLATLRELGVHIGQGYLLSRPLREEQIYELLSVSAVTPACG